MAQMTYLVCDSCKAEGHRAGVGATDIQMAEVTVKMSATLWWQKDLCSSCREKLQEALKFLGPTSSSS